MEAGSSTGVFRAYLRLARPRQWTKNGFVLAGLVFAEEALNPNAILSALLAFAAFCALSGSVYAANDVLDVKEDRKHPVKRLRPVAGGEIPPAAAWAFSVVLALLGLGLALYVNLYVALAGLGYLLLQTLYTYVFKHMAILDVMSISGGFVLRAMAGVAAVAAPISSWLLVCTGLLTLFLGFSKRRYEIAGMGEEAKGHRRNLADYSVGMLDEMMNIMLSATIIAYTLYTITVYEMNYMMASIPFVIYGVFRYMLLVHRDGGDNPDTMLLRDRPLQVSILLWLATVMVVIYLFPASP